MPQVPVSYEEQQQQHVQQAQHAQREYKTQQHMQKHEQQMLSQSPPTRDPVTYYDGSIGGPPSGAKASNTPQVPVLMSKVLNVANIPFDMPPKELFDMFAETGAVDGSYIFPYADQLNRRFGHIVMSSFFTAQKVCSHRPRISRELLTIYRPLRPITDMSFVVAPLRSLTGRMMRIQTQPARRLYHILFHTISLCRKLSNKLFSNLSNNHSRSTSLSTSNNLHLPPLCTIQHFKPNTSR